MSQFRSRLLGMGAYVPANVVTNHDLATMMDTTHDWIVERTGIVERRWVLPGEGGAEMATAASKQAIERSGLTPQDIDFIIYATLSPDHGFPGTAVFVQRMLGIKDIPCLDIRQQCTGFVYGLSIADAFIRTGQYKNILLIGSEVHSTGLDKTTAGRDVTVLFGDGAGAVVVGRAVDDSQMILSTHLHADGSDAEMLWLEYPASRNHPRIDNEAIAAGKHFPSMNGRRVFKHAAAKVPEVLHEALAANNVRISDIDMMIPHQANLRITALIAEQLGIPPEKTHSNIHKYGNTTAASIPICMNEAIEIGKIKRGQLIALTAFGAGLTWGATLLRY
jgi:3-oxoacyl-[acyl-carrier-protein] synthase III